MKKAAVASDFERVDNPTHRVIYEGHRPGVNGSSNIFKKKQSSRATADLPRISGIGRGWPFLRTFA
jgi:hypothetical protein